MIDIRHKNCSKELMNSTLPTFVDFFVGSGLVTQGAEHACTPVWSNDICPKKAAIYTANHGPGQILKTLDLCGGGFLLADSNHLGKKGRFHL